MNVVFDPCAGRRSFCRSPRMPRALPAVTATRCTRPTTWHGPSTRLALAAVARTNRHPTVAVRLRRVGNASVQETCRPLKRAMAVEGIHEKEAQSCDQPGRGTPEDV